MNREAIQLRFNRDGERLRLAERVLLSVCRPVQAAPLAVATYSYTLDNALDYARRLVPHFPARVFGKTVLDYGCGPGWQAVAMRLAGAASVDGVDINAEWVTAGRALAASAGVTDVTFDQTPRLPAYDVVISLGAMEHYHDPQKELLRMAALARQEIIISFADPWFSPYGTHLDGTTKLPWLNLVFSDRTRMNVRNLYPDGSDGAKRVEDVRGGLNKMTLSRFRELVSAVPGFRVEHLFLRGVKGLPLVTKLPAVRELMTSAVTCVLRPVGGRSA
jgi:2-polyprenyl-3-methyl-5-hydroxy-6-metoxy-1,4-benzoquinol methylase